MSPSELTGIANPTEAFHAIYTSADLMVRWVGQAATLRARLARALQCLSTAREPRYRFRLEATPAEVVSALEGLVAALEATAGPAREELTLARAEGHAWDTAWRYSPTALEMGFGPGDGHLLGVR